MQVPSAHVFFLSSSWSKAAVLDYGMTPGTESDTLTLPILSFLSILDAYSNFTKFLWLVGHEEALQTLDLFFGQLDVF